MDLANLATLLFISGNVHPYPGPISNHPHPRHPCSICHLDVGRDSLQCSACLKWVHFLCSFLTVLTFAQSVQLALQWAGDAQRAIPKRKLALPLRPVSLLRRLRPLPPSPGFPPLPPGFYHSRPPRGLPRYPCSICSLDVGKDSLKCSTSSKWVHFSCSSLTRDDFRKICAAGSLMGWNCPACLNGDLVSPTHRPASPRLVSPALPPPTPTPLACSDLMDSSLPLPSHPPLFNICPPSAFTLPASLPQLHSRSTTCHRTPKEIHASHTISEFCNGMPAVFPPPAVLN